MVIYKNDDLLLSDCNVICHQVNCKGVMNAGIAKSIRKRYPEVYKVFIVSFCEKKTSSVKLMLFIIKPSAVSL